MDTSRKRLLTSENQIYTFLPLIVLEVVVLVFTNSLPQFVLFSVQGVLLLSALIGIFILSWKYEFLSEKLPAGPVLLPLGYFAIYVGLLTSSVPGNYVWLLAMPIICYSVMLQPWPAAVAVAFLYLGTTVWLFRPPQWGWRDLANGTMNFGAAYVFTAVFSFAVKRALQARATSAKLAAELESANEQLRLNAARQAEFAATQERNRIARDIHDGVGHYLTVVTVQIQAARALLPQDPAQAQASLKVAEEFTQRALGEVRNSVSALREQRDRRSLPEAVAALVAESGLNVRLAVKGDERSTSPAVNEALFRAAQEGLTNVRKHAAATEVKLVLEYGDGRILLDVQDNGNGPVGKSSKGSGFGLVGLRERLQAVGGNVQTLIAPEGGFCLRVEIPA